MAGSVIHHGRREHRGWSPKNGGRIREAAVEGYPTKHHTHSRGLGTNRPSDCNRGVHRLSEDERFIFGHLVRTREEGAGRNQGVP